MEDDTDGGAPRRSRGRWLARAAAAAVVLALLVAVGRLLAPRPDGTDEAADVPVLHRWELLGCWDLRVAPWRVVWRDRLGGADGRPGRDGRGGERRPSGRAAPSADRGDGDLPASFAPPNRLMLLPDSVDRWGRVLPSRRAVALEGDDRPGRSLRWAVHADTLWLLWSEGDTRAGVALRPEGDTLAGRVRIVRGGDSLDATASASARRINCSTGAPEPSDLRRELRRR